VSHFYTMGLSSRVKRQSINPRFAADRALPPPYPKSFSTGDRFDSPEEMEFIRVRTSSQWRSARFSGITGPLLHSLC